VLERLERETIALSTLAPERILATITGLDNASPALKDAAVKLAALVADLNSATARRAEFAAETKRIADDQTRIRQILRRSAKAPTSAAAMSTRCASRKIASPRSRPPTRRCRPRSRTSARLRKS
jgi:hypothetical protein